MIRVIIDTNILVSALLNPSGLPAQILLLALNGTIEMCVTGPIYAEYEDVIRRPRFSFEEKIIAALLSAIRDQAVWVKPTTKVRVCSDPDDNMFLECAETACANYLVTGNLKHFPNWWKETEVVTPRRLIEVIQPEDKVPE
jgi:uncharacterized protein